MVERKTNISGDVALVHELRDLVPGELVGSLEQVAGRLNEDRAFQRGLDMYRRVVAAPQSGGSEDLVLRARGDFSRFATAHILHKLGVTLTEIEHRLGSDLPVAWLRLGQVPEVLFDNDPIRGELFVKRMSPPQGESADFAYMLGAHAGTRRLGTKAETMSFTSREEKLIERLAAATLQSCGSVLGRQVAIRGGLERFSASSRAHEFVEYLHEITGGNARVPWQHLQTSAERRAFIGGFLDFAGGSINVEEHRLIIGRRHNPGILEEMAIVMKREGILTRVSRREIPSLHIESYYSLERLRNEGMVSAERVVKPLEASLQVAPGFRTGRPEQYVAVMAMAERMARRGDVSADDVARMLKREGNPAGEVPYNMIRQWIRGGHVPASVVRLRELEALEARLFTPARRAEIGQAIIARLGAEPRPRRVVSAVVEFLGGVGQGSRITGLPERIVTELDAGSRLPSRAEYRLMLQAIGLELTRDLERGIKAPESRDIERWLRSEGERRVFGSYRSSIVLLARETFERGDDPAEAVRARIAKLMKRNSSMIVDG